MYQVTKKDVDETIKEYPIEITRLKRLIRRGEARTSDDFPLTSFARFRESLCETKGNFFTIKNEIEETFVINNIHRDYESAKPLKMQNRTLKLSHSDIEIITDALSSYRKRKLKLIAENAEIITPDERKKMVADANRYGNLEADIKEDRKDI